MNTTQPTSPGHTTKLVAAMGDLGPTDARTLSEAAGVPYSTTVKRLRDWTATGQITKIERGKEAAHFALLDGTAPEVAPSMTGAGIPAEGNATQSPDPAGVEPAPGTDQAGRRKRGVLRDAVLQVLRDNPSQDFKVIEVCRVLERNLLATGHGTRKVSSGAVANALATFVVSGDVVRTVERPATYRAA
ncbi:hypothetical protein Lfu02_77110 [Longispora fulva]|uniref:Uncharacterized protein n=1 Tax=Longispora fulva TaxID=619741 RepID=A0A8J7KFG9_9ACTN|nr:hypothetical protein [Longispora fulva]MBG6136170.1 hypothetical protein [Longispora fulva]GIG63339.1 hypothetical protein Lfu02_77110 [Longispora fulva]